MQIIGGAEMIIYHGSDTIVKMPKIIQSDRFHDFGIGFYTTTNLTQAKRWARKVSIRRKSKSRFISIYEFDESKSENFLEIIRFVKPNEDWLNFVCTCRSGKKLYIEYDMVIGPVADDSVYTTVVLFESGVLDKDETIKRLKIEKLYDQVLFHTEKSLRSLRFTDYIQLGGERNG